MKLLAMLSVVCLAMAAPAWAGMTVTFHDSYGSPGGEFLLDSSGFDFVPQSLGEAPGKFETFCLERDEYVKFGKTFYADLATSAKNGPNLGKEVDPLDSRTAYLYSQFISGGLTGYNYTPGSDRVASANALQRAIWYIENEISWSKLNTLARSFYYQADDAVSGGEWSGLGNVRVLNLYGNVDKTDYAQDQLVAVPVPGAMLLGSIGLGGIGLIQRRRMR